MWENGVFVVVEVSKKTQKLIALVFGVILLGVIVAIVVRDYRADNPADTTADNSKVETPTDETKNEAETEADKAEPIEKVEEVKEETTEESEVAEPKTTTKDYSYTAAPGDSYTVLARDAVRQYSTANKLSLSDGQVVQAAAILAANAGSPFLEIGQAVTIERDDIVATLGIEDTASGEPTKVVEPTTTADKAKDSANTYNYTAAAGDSYSLLARQAIDDYATNTTTGLTNAQRVAAESTIVSDAGFPELRVGQAVSFYGDDVKAAVEASKQLSAAQLALWQPYADLASL